MVKECEMPRPLALTGITVHIETLHEMTKQQNCYRVLGIYIFGQVDTLNKNKTCKLKLYLLDYYDVK